MVLVKGKKPCVCVRFFLWHIVGGGGWNSYRGFVQTACHNNGEWLFDRLVTTSSLVR
jgi:hypothetical protein